MRGGGGLLAAVVAALWGGVYLITQVVVQPPLPTDWTVLAGVALTMVLIVGYPSPLRGPRAGRRRVAGRRTVGHSRGAVQAGATGPRHVSGQARAAGGRTDGGSRSTIAVVGRSMPLRGGLTAEAADRTVRLLRPLMGVDAVAITDREKVLAFTGPGRDHHQPGGELVSGATARVLAGSRTAVVRHRRQLACPVERCPLRTAAIAPLSIQGRPVGALKVYRVDEIPPSRELVEGMAAILSLHLELADLDRQRQLAADAQLNALRAQINPHFLFNTLNTIASKARTDPDAARRLLLRLSDFFRYAIRQDGQFADFGEEYFFVRTYLSLEQARFGDRLSVRYDVDPQVLGVQVPVLTIQPLVENAVKHGLADKIGGGTVSLRTRVDPLARTTIIQVRDDGVGMDEETVARILHGNGSVEGGIGLRNISDRLATLFGERYRLDVRSRPGEGTTVDLRIPLR